MKYTPGNITNKTKANPGGVCYFLFAPIEWVETAIRESVVDNKVLTEVALISGKSWLKATCMQDTIGFSEVGEITPAGKKYTLQITGVLNGDDQALNTLFNALDYHDYIVITVDRTRQKKLVGNKTHGMRVVTDNNTGTKYAEKRASNITLQFESDHRSPVYPF